MSFYYQKKDLDKFFELYEKDKENIFGEIYSYLGERKFNSKEDFKTNYLEILSKEKKERKKLSSGLILQKSKFSSRIELRDKNNTFNLAIDFIKKIELLDSKTNTFETNYIISETYFFYYYQKLKKNKIKYIFKNNSEEKSLLFIEDFEKDIIYNKDFKYIVINPDFENIYTKIFNILKNEKELEDIPLTNLFNEFRILNFPEINKEDVKKIELKIMDFKDYCLGYKYLCYNKKIGMSLLTQRLLIVLFQKNIKNFYCNIDFLYKEVDVEKIRNYIFFYLAFLFSLEEQEKFKDFIENNILNLIYNYKGEQLILNLLELLYKNFGDNFTLYVDNVKTRAEFELIQKFMGANAKEDVFILIQINQHTLYCLLEIKMQFRLIENRDMGTSIEDDLEYYIPLSLNKIDHKKIKKDYNEKIQKFFKKVDYPSYLYLLKLKYLINTEDFDLNQLIDIDSFLEFLIVKIYRTKVFSIEFRNDYIKEIFENNYIGYISRFQNTNIDNNIFYEITKTEEGINFERQITYDLLIKNIDMEKIKIDKIFSIKSFDNNEFQKNKDYLFIQNNSNAPYYDIGFLYNLNGLTIFKACQIGINKPRKELKKLDKEFIFFDLNYFSELLQFEKGIKIDELEFCIITTFNAYLENEEFLQKKIKGKDRKYNNFENMKKFCEENDYIFLIFDIKNFEFYRFNKKNEIKKTDLKYDKFQIEVKNLFIKNKYISETKRIEYNFNPEKPRIIGKIKLPENFNEKKLNKSNKEYEIKIANDVVIYKKAIESSKDDSKNSKETDSNSNKIKPKSTNDESNKKFKEDDGSKKRKRDKNGEDVNLSKNKKKKTN